MTEPAQIRLNIDPALRDNFKAACQRSGLSMAEQTARMIGQFVGGIAPAGEEITADLPPAEGQPGEPEPPPPSLEVWLEDILDDHRDMQLAAMKNLATGDNLIWLLDRINADADKRHEGFAKTVQAISGTLSESIESSHKRWQGLIAVRLRDRFWLGGAALAGMAVLGLLLALVSGTGLGRKLAVALTGGDNKWQAALLLVGDGSWLNSQLIVDTRSLLASPDFRLNYATCIERAARANRAITCKLVMPALPEKR